MVNKPDTQAQKFKKTARELECDESEERFNAALKTIGKQKSGPTELVPNRKSAPGKRSR